MQPYSSADSSADSSGDQSGADSSGTGQPIAGRRTAGRGRGRRMMKPIDRGGRRLPISPHRRPPIQQPDASGTDLSGPDSSAATSGAGLSGPDSSGPGQIRDMWKRPRIGMPGMQSANFPPDGQINESAGPIGVSDRFQNLFGRVRRRPVRLLGSGISSPSVF